MSRNSSGTYSLPAGNPVVTGTTITSTWANTTLSDIATALTDSLSRTGQGGMQAGLPLADGTASLPGLSWGTELTSGFYRAGAADYRWVVTTTELLQLTTNLVRISGTAPVLRLNESDAAANNRLWDVIASAEDLNFRVLTDALVATNWLTIARTAGVVDSVTLAATAFSCNSAVTLTLQGSAATPTLLLNSNQPYFIMNEGDAAADNRRWYWTVASEQMELGTLNDANTVSAAILQINRTGTVVDTVNFATGTLQYAGTEVGYRGLPRRDISGSDNTAASDNGRTVRYTGSGGHTFTGDADLATEGLMEVKNTGTGTLTLAASGTLTWLNGSGALATGSRTLAIGGVCSMNHTGAGNYYVYGTGLS